ncbi:cyclin-H-like isoform X3 [Gordionus sp. m RMFG-2023]|uniref:cyclin-H-like isoform X3 n=1 Tax=Gordionus sp. m RMFG-2023 TaxID=3053472 RepID=UPI0031FE0D8B
MFSNSTQKKHWVFSDESILDKLKYESSQNYIIKFTEKFQGFIESLDDVFLTLEEEKELQLYYEKKLWDFYTLYFYEIPRSVVDMAFTYYKRFYLVTSVIDFHPKEILVTCLFLACKVDEYNLTLPQFLSNIKGDKKKLAETRYPLLKDPDKLRIGSGMFLDALLFTNACFLFTPSQIALTSLVVSSQKIGEDLTNTGRDCYEIIKIAHFEYAHCGYIVSSILHICDYIYVELLYENSTLEDKSILQNSIKKIQELASSSVFSNSEKFYAIDKNPNIKIIESKLEKCRNPENNPDAPEFTRKIRIEMGLDDFPDD